MSELLVCGAKVEHRVWSHWQDSDNAEESARVLQLLEMYKEPRSLKMLAACVVRKSLAAAEFDGVIKNTDRLPLPTSLKALLKLEN